MRLEQTCDAIAALSFTSLELGFTEITDIDALAAARPDITITQP